MDTLSVLRDLLFWCMVIHFGLLLVWFLFFRFAHDGMYRLHTRWFQLSREQFDALHYAGITFYKILFLVFNAIPWIVLQWVL